jgi:hypothetical protein
MIMSSAVYRTDYRENDNNPHLCHTQSRVQNDFDIQKWLVLSAGNHQVIVYGNLLPELKLFCEFKQMRIDINEME